MVEMRVEEMGDGIDAIAFVDEPAIGRYFTAFNRAKAKTRFSVDLKNKRVVGPLLIPNALVYRNEPEEHYQYFTVEGIEQAVHAFMRRGDLRRLNLMHSGRKCVSALVQGVWIKRVPGAMYPGDECPVGTAYAEVLIEDPAILKMIQSGEIKGFSMEGFYGGVTTGKTAHSLSKPMSKTKPKTFGERVKALFGVKPKTAYITVMVGETPVDLAEDGTVDVVMEDGSTRKLVLMEAETVEELSAAMAEMEADDPEDGELEKMADVATPVDVTAQTALRTQLAQLQADNAALRTQLATAKKPGTKPVNPKGQPGVGATAGKQKPTVGHRMQESIDKANEKRVKMGLPPIGTP